MLAQGRRFTLEAVGSGGADAEEAGRSGESDLIWKPVEPKRQRLQTTTGYPRKPRADQPVRLYKGEKTLQPVGGIRKT